MRKIFTLLILLLLLPVTALAAEGAPGSLYVAGQQITDEGYYTQSGGNWTKSDATSTPPSAPYFHYTKGNDNTPATLTLSGATIQGGTSTGTVPYGAGIYAQCSNGQSVTLTIKLIGENTITGYYGIYVNAEISADSYGTDASLTITSENNGSLEVSGSNHGIFVKSGTRNASLNIEKATVTSSTNSNYDAGVFVSSSTEANVSPNLSLAVNGGSLTASGGESSDGIWFYVGSSQASNATTSLTVSDNAIVRANGGIKAYHVDEPTPSGTGIVFDGTEGTVYGEVILQEDLEIGEGESLTIPEGSSLNSNGKLTNNGTIIVKEGGKLEGEPGGTVVSAPTIGTQPASQTVTEGNTATFTVAATGGNLSYQWQQSTDNGSRWTNIESATNATYTIETTTMDMSGTQYRCVVKNTINEVTSEAATLTVKHNLVKVEAKAPTCTEPGNIEYWYCEGCGKHFSDDNGTIEITDVTIPATNHSYGEPVYTWSDDYAACTATRTCENNDEHIETVTATVTSEQTQAPTCTEPGKTTYTATFKVNWAKKRTKTVADIPATGHHYVNGYCTECGHRDPDYRPDPISYYNIYVEDVCDGVEVSTSKQVVREGGSINVYVEKDTARYTFDNFKVYYKRSYYGTWDELKEGTQPGEYPIKNIWNHIYIKAEGAEEKEDPTGIESIEGVKVYTKDGSLYVQTPQREQVIIVSMSGAVVKNEEQIGLKQYHGLQPGIYIVRVGDRAYKLRLH